MFILSAIIIIVQCTCSLVELNAGRVPVKALCGKVFWFGKHIESHKSRLKSIRHASTNTYHQCGVNDQQKIQEDKMSTWKLHREQFTANPASITACQSFENQDHSSTLDIRRLRSLPLSQRPSPYAKAGRKDLPWTQTFPPMWSRWRRKGQSQWAANMGWYWQ